MAGFEKFDVKQSNDLDIMSISRYAYASIAYSKP